MEKSNDLQSFSARGSIQCRNEAVKCEQACNYCPLSGKSVSKIYPLFSVRTLVEKSDRRISD